MFIILDDPSFAGPYLQKNRVRNKEEGGLFCFPQFLDLNGFLGNCSENLKGSLCYFPCRHMNNGNRITHYNVQFFQNPERWEKTATQRNSIIC